MSYEEWKDAGAFRGLGRTDSDHLMKLIENLERYYVTHDINLDGKYGNWWKCVAIPVTLRAFHSCPIRTLVPCAVITDVEERIQVIHDTYQAKLQTIPWKLRIDLTKYFENPNFDDEVQKSILAGDLLSDQISGAVLNNFWQAANFREVCNLKNMAVVFDRFVQSIQKTKSRRPLWIACSIENAELLVKSWYVSSTLDPSVMPAFMREAAKQKGNRTSIRICSMSDWPLKICIVPDAKNILVGFSNQRFVFAIRHMVQPVPGVEDTTYLSCQSVISLVGDGDSIGRIEVTQ